MKPDIVFFGEGLPDAFHDAMAKDKDVCDLLIVIGSSLKVRPVALIPSSIPSYVPQILINRESLPHLKFDVELLGDGDVIINQLCHLMANGFEEVCWRDELLKEAQTLAPRPLYPTDDPWERSQDTETLHELSQDSEEVNRVPQQHNTSSDSQDSLMINANTTPKRLENTEICISPFQAGHMENTEASFSLLGESPKRPLGDSSVESSPKRINLGTECETSPTCESTSQSTDESEENSRYSGSGYTRVISVESTSENNGQIFNLDECHVVPRITDSTDITSTIDSSIESTPRSLDDILPSLLSDEDLVENDKISSKARHVSIDSAIDSGIGDSCNSVDSHEKLEAENSEMKVDKLERRCWQPKIKASLAARLPENSYYQISSGKYIFPGAEVYFEPEEYDRCSLSANSESSSSDSDSSSSSSGEEETCKCLLCSLIYQLHFMEH